MLFSGKPDKRDAAKEGEKKRSTFGLLFGPDIGGSLRPVGESAAHFVRLVATIFAAQGLFPRNHPALLGDPKARLTMGMVIAAAWARLEFRRDNLHKIALFFTLVGGLVFTALALLFTALALFSGSAHAAGMFDPAGPDDWGENWLNYIFLGQPFSPSVATGTAPHATSDFDVQTALKTALAMYSNAILVLAGVILLYHLMAMVAETAHSGVPMGKSANQIWAPIRLVVAVALLVPVGQSGLNSGQYIVIQMAKWGSGLASQAWGLFLDTMNNKYTSGGCGGGGSSSPSCQNRTVDARSVAESYVMNQMCMKTYNYYTKVVISAFIKDSSNSALQVLYTTFTAPEVRKITIPDGYYLGTSIEGERQLCGGLLKPQKPEFPYDAVYKKQMDIWNDFETKADNEIVNKFVDYFLEGTDKQVAYNKDGGGIPFGSLTARGIIRDFETKITQANRDSLKLLDATVKSKEAQQLSRDAGWLGAGAWFNHISRHHSARVSAMQNSLPIVFPRTFSSDPKGSLKSVHDKTTETLARIQKWLSPDGSSEANAPPAHGSPDEVHKSPPSAEEWAKSMTKDTSNLKHPINWALMLVNWLGESTGVWTSDGRLGIRFDRTINPLAEVTAYGHNNISLAMSLLEFSGIGAAALSAASDSFLGSIPWVGSIIKFASFVASFLLGIIIPIATLLFTSGVAIGFLLPLMPFMRFFFGSLTWIIGVFEAVVAAPLLALAHLSPEGAGLAGPAKGGYYFILNIFLRPVLMVFGLVAGFLLFAVAISFLNTLFIVASEGTGAWNGEFGVLAKVIFTTIYCGMVYVCGNNCFKSVGFFPQYALRWLGQSGHQESMGDPNTIAAASATAAAYMGDKAFPAIANAPKQWADKWVEDRKKKRDNAEANKKHTDMLDAIKGSKDSKVAGTDASGNAGQLPPPERTAAGNDDAAAGAGTRRGPQEPRRSGPSGTGRQFTPDSGVVQSGGREGAEKGHAAGRRPPPGSRTAETQQNSGMERSGDPAKAPLSVGTRESTATSPVVTTPLKDKESNTDNHDPAVTREGDSADGTTTFSHSPGTSITPEQLQNQRQAQQMAEDPYTTYLNDGMARYAGATPHDTTPSALQGSGIAQLSASGSAPEKPTAPPSLSDHKQSEEGSGDNTAKIAEIVAKTEAAATAEKVVSSWTSTVSGSHADKRKPPPRKS